MAMLHAKEGEMNLFLTLRNRLGLDFEERAHREVRREEEAVSRKTAERYSRGSVGIQKGAFQTRDDLDRSLERQGLSPPDRK
jgi:hypothetical protein